MEWNFTWMCFAAVFGFEVEGWRWRGRPLRTGTEVRNGRVINVHAERPGVYQGLAWLLIAVKTWTL